ncbi:chlororespiratory reduction 6 domain-containing protein [Oxalobacteraceae bacterium R-40]|uniref:Chlororespiratory reduction 6 domain-containing protein n=1 Tax=Keguizhuia sedimenti TaxID=3064264 RepID=A0ABU1BSM7_9BURK|nr:chlororespiratory reduction 6 domain-containing protein [Oxalobacteraceae bacterium R-40]
MQHPYSGLIGGHVTVVTIPREDIERGAVDVAVSSLNKLVASKAALETSNGTISLLVSGYDHDPRELYMIPEVRAYFQALDAAFPYWFHVLARLEHSLRMVFMLLADLTPVPSPDGSVQVQFANDDLHAFLEQHFQAMDSIHGKYGFSEEKNAQITELVMNYFDALIGR